MLRGLAPSSRFIEARQDEECNYSILVRSVTVCYSPTARFDLIDDIEHILDRIPEQAFCSIKNMPRHG